MKWRICSEAYVEVFIEVTADDEEEAEEKANRLVDEIGVDPEGRISAPDDVQLTWSGLKSESWDLVGCYEDDE